MPAGGTGDLVPSFVCERRQSVYPFNTEKEVGRAKKYTYSSHGQSAFASIWIRSGRVAANSLYTVHAEARILLPPFAAQLRTIVPIISEVLSAWKS